MSAPNIRSPFGEFLRACFIEYKASLPDGKISERLWIEKVDEWHAAWTLFRKPKRKKRGGPMTDEEWIASLKADPFLEGVDIDKEVAKCQFHFRNQPHPIVPSRARIVNWLKNADKKYTPVKFTPSTEPTGWLEWMRANRPGWRRFHEEAEGHPVPAWKHLPIVEQTVIMGEMKKTP